MNKTIYGNKLASYASREPKSFLQLDAFYYPYKDDASFPDKDGDTLMAGGTIELMDGTSVRVLIPHDAKPKDVVRQLKKITKWLSKDSNLFALAKPIPKERYDRSEDCPF